MRKLYFKRGKFEKNYNYLIIYYTNFFKPLMKGMRIMEEKSLRITGTDKTFLNKITNTLTKMLIPTKIGINGMLISI